MISTKGRYSLRILIDLAQHRNGSYIPMKDVAKRQGISLKYIERLLPPLKEAGLTKAEIRKLSFDLGLKTYDKPSFACLASRFPYGETISKEKLFVAEMP
jgi:PP-loop superfamily ATP-utilizing enzyme